ncbi:transglycosylase SLT domain-containing protein [Sphingomonas changnyeongensis]|uniref:Transglycosylase SLT domain-containing protein n=2 Tax=Sphingomonas changnyeongensis TaxID=2698679 RepID=A0A7Z2NX79_9SPHN|nr:lytic transglycosylase domain-containing protein [Sphingomonas changnyeongensis]QHL91508.1 transglycosylase SLT domain-containing protein [Sphingomonas changnyeongensis]
MSSMVSRILPLMLLFGASASIADQRLVPADQGVAPQPYNANDPLLGAVAQWNALRQTADLPFDSYAGFLIAHPGWPGETALRRRAEQALLPGQVPPARIAAFFDRFPPLTNQGQARHAEALAALGRRAEALAAARKAWTSGTLSPADEALVLGQFGASFTAADQDERMDRLLWAGKTSAATRQLALTSPARRALFTARLALRTNAPDAAALAGQMAGTGNADAGFVADMAVWRRHNGDMAGMRALLAEQRSYQTRPVDAEKWLEFMLAAARGAAAEGDWAGAHAIARQLDQAFAPGTDVQGRSNGERDDYTSLAWLAGTAALNRLGRPADAVPMFDRYARAAKSPQTQAKGHYWAGRAAQAAGRTAEASRYFALSAAHPDQFYGQLALERLGRPIPAPGTPGATRVAAEDRVAFNRREIVRVARLLGAAGRWQEQTQFVRAISAAVESDAEHALAAELAQGIGRPDLAVMVGRSARVNGASDYVRTGYPLVKVPVGQEAWTTIIHAIARQESQFDRAAVSHAGARGLMQLMPGTAREQAEKIGLSYDAPALTENTDYNIQLGSSYFQRMLSYYGGSYPLAIAAYNAGPGNVNKWLKANGDPRLPGQDMIRWIEEIPVFETRNYVQRVLENAVVYDTLHPGRAHKSGPNLLSAYLGKAIPG